MTVTTTEATVPADTPTSSTAPTNQATRSQSAQPVLEKLYALYPHLFGASFLPLKLGVFQELLTRHPDDLDRDTLKHALGVHTRSSRYLQCVAAGMKRHDLQGVAVDDVAPEHIYFALVELSRRKQLRSKEDLRPKLRARLLSAFEASGLTRQDYQARVQTNDASACALLAEAFAELDQQLARQEALRRAFESSGKSVEEFADMYGMALRDVTRVLGSNDSSPTTP
jgi:sRNA-binding protein